MFLSTQIIFHNFSGIKFSLFFIEKLTILSLLLIINCFLTPPTLTHRIRSLREFVVEHLTVGLKCIKGRLDPMIARICFTSAVKVIYHWDALNTNCRPASNN